MKTRELSNCRYGTLIKDSRLAADGLALIHLAIELVRIVKENAAEDALQEELSTYIRQSTQHHLPPSPSSRPPSSAGL